MAYKSICITNYASCAKVSYREVHLLVKTKLPGDMANELRIMVKYPNDDQIVRAHGRLQVVDTAFVL